MGDSTQFGYFFRWWDCLPGVSLQWHQKDDQSF